MSKMKNKYVTQGFLDARAQYAIENGYSKQKWIQFCERMFEYGFKVRLYEARKTVSKYVTVIDPETGATYKVRFSDHKPIKYREAVGDCDFFVGHTNFKITNTAQAINAAVAHLMGIRIKRLTS